MTLTPDSSAIRCYSYDGKLSSSKSKRLDVHRSRRKNSSFSSASTITCSYTDGSSKPNNPQSVSKSCSNLKNRCSSEKENVFEKTQERNIDDQCICWDPPLCKADVNKILCPPYNKKAACRSNVCIRRVPIVPKSQLKISCAPLNKDTTYKTDYIAKDTCPPKPIKHIPQLKNSSAPLNEETTYRDAYQAKPISKRKGIYPNDEMTISCEPIQGKTITMTDYKVPQGFVPSCSFRPDNTFEPSPYPLADKTTHRTDYVPWNTRGPVGPFPWTPGKDYESPVVPFLGDTTYRISYKYPDYMQKTGPFIPKEQGIGITGCLLEDWTTYKHDYQPCTFLNEIEAEKLQPNRNASFRKHDLPILCC